MQHNIELPTQLLQERIALQTEIKNKESELDKDRAKLEEVENQLISFIMDTHPNPKCVSCGRRLKNHNARHRFEPDINNALTHYYK
jgi:hypothetical protein